MKFDYLDEAPSQWGECLAKIRQAGHACIELTVLWGAHEQTRGIRDFTKSSRLRLEKLFKEVQQKGLSLELTLGFPPHNETFPSWLMGEKRQALVPLSLKEGRPQGALLTWIPFLSEENFQEGFLGFLSDVFTFVDLYRFPQGPIKRVLFDFAVYEANVNHFEDADFGRALEERYLSIDRLNANYQTLFKNFQSVASKQGFKVLCDKRPWLAAYDYKWVRNRLLSQFRECIARLERTQAVLDLVEMGGNGNTGTYAGGVIADTTLVERIGNAVLPLAIGGYVTSASIRACRLLEFLHHYAGITSPAPSVQAVLCGRYLSRKDFDSLMETLKTGVELHFPFGLPQYDEHLSCYEWHAARKEAQGLKRMISDKWGKSAIWISDPALQEDDSFFHKLENVRSYLMARH